MGAFQIHAVYRDGGTRKYSRIVEGGIELALIDLDGQYGTLLAFQRLRMMQLDYMPKIVVFRNASAHQLIELVGEVQPELGDLFKGAKVVVSLQFEPKAQFTVHRGSLGDVEVQRLLDAISSLEVESTLVGSGAILSSDYYHFSLFNGTHTNRFIRVGDALKSRWSIERLCDWVQNDYCDTSLIVLDTPTLIPIVNELRFRQAFRGLELASQYVVLPTYGIDQRESVLRLSEDFDWARRVGVPIHAIASVAASGGWFRQFDNTLSMFGWGGPVVHTLVCEASPSPSRRALAHIITEVKATGECDWCLVNRQQPVPIDPENFTTKLYLGTHRVPLPNHEILSELSEFASILDATQAASLHVDDAFERRHLGIWIDVRKLLNDRRFFARAEASFERLVGDEGPDLVLVPENAGARSTAGWIASRTSAAVHIVSKNGTFDDAVLAAVRSASRILIADECIISGRTMRGLLESVQRVRRGYDRFWLGAFAFLGRSEEGEIHTWLRDRFFLDKLHCLELGWSLPLPNYDSRTCPWCIESDWIKRMSERLDGASLRYVQDRLATLDSRTGLVNEIFLGASLAKPKDYARAVNTTARSYLGHTSDVSCFIALSSGIQRLRDSWNRNPESISKRLVFPLAGSLGRFTDPVIAGSILRVLGSAETESAEMHEKIPIALRSIAHRLQHPVHMGELAFASYRRIIPARAVLDHFVGNLREADGASYDVLGQLLDYS